MKSIVAPEIVGPIFKGNQTSKDRTSRFAARGEKRSDRKRTVSEAAGKLDKWRIRDEHVGMLRVWCADVRHHTASN